MVNHYLDDAGAGTTATIGALDLGVLRGPSLRRLLAAQWASLSGDWTMIAALPFVVFSLGGGAGQVGLAFAVCAVSISGVVLLGGVLADRRGRRAMMIVAEMMRCASQGGFAVLLLVGSAHFWQILVAEAAIGAGTGLAQPAVSGLLSEVVPGRDLQSANALRTLLASVATLTGPGLAGAAIILAGPGAAVALDSLSFAISALLVMGIHPRRVVDRVGGHVDSVFAELRSGWQEFKSRTWLWVVVVEFACLNMLVFGPFQVLGSGIAHNLLGGAGAWSSILLALGLGQVGGAVGALAWKPARPLRSSTLLVLGWVPLLVAMGLGASLATILPAAVVAGAGWSVLVAIWESTLQAMVPQDQVSSLSAYDWLGSTALMPLGFLIAAPVATTIGAGAGLVVAASIVVAATAVVISVPSVRNMSRRPYRSGCDQVSDSLVTVGATPDPA